MRLNKLAASTIASLVLFGGVGQLAINAQPAQALKATQTTTVAAKPSSLLGERKISGEMGAQCLGTT